MFEKTSAGQFGKVMSSLTLRNSLKLVAITGMQISRNCFTNLVEDFCTTFLRVAHECCEHFRASPTGREGFKHV